ncbi:hypothetical protein ACVI1L_004767 [Bradyrhizobium sp. USDA 4516]
MAEAIHQLSSTANENSQFRRADRFAMSNGLFEPVLAVRYPPRGDGSNYLSYEPVAPYCYESGNKDRALESVEVTLESPDAPEPIRDKVKKHVMSL